MSNFIYLFKEHQNFQVGKTRLKKGSVFETNFYWLVFWLLVTLACIWAGGSALRLSWHYGQTGAETTGLVTDCDEIRGNKGGYTSYVTYNYVVNETMYSHRDNVGGGQLCDDYIIGQRYPVYYLSDNPQESGINSFLHSDDWLVLLIFGGGGIVGIIVVFVMLMQNRNERYKHALLQNADTLIEAKVTNIGAVSGKGGYLYADYRFQAPKGNFVKAQIRSGKQYTYPKDIQAGDRLTILYHDDKTYCVL